MARPPNSKRIGRFPRYDIQNPRRARHVRRRRPRARHRHPRHRPSLALLQRRRRSEPDEQPRPRRRLRRAARGEGRPSRQRQPQVGCQHGHQPVGRHHRPTARAARHADRPAAARAQRANPRGTGQVVRARASQLGAEPTDRRDTARTRRPPRAQSHRPEREQRHRMRALPVAGKGRARADRRQRRLLLPRTYADAYPITYAYAKPDADRHPNAYAVAYADCHPNAHAVAYAHPYPDGDPDARAPHRLRLSVGEFDDADRRPTRHAHGERLHQPGQPSAVVHLSGTGPQRRMAVRYIALRRHARFLAHYGGVAFLPRDRLASRVRGDRRLQPGHRHVVGSPHRDAYSHANVNPNSYPDPHADDIRNGLLERHRRAQPLEQPRLGERLRRVDGGQGHAARNQDTRLGLWQSHRFVGGHHRWRNTAESHVA